MSQIALTQSQNQTLSVTPELQQSLKFLQLSAEELNKEIEAELIENPALEINSEAFDFKIKNISLESEIEAKEKPLSLCEVLSAQLRELDLTDRERQIALMIVLNLDEQGFLPKDIKSFKDVTDHEFDQALINVQGLEPAGIATRSLCECLLIQLERSGRGTSLAARILKNHSILLEKLSFSLIAKMERISIKDVTEALKVLRTLNPSPVSEFTLDNNSAISPDIYIEKIDDTYRARLNGSLYPPICVSSSYKRLFKGKRNEASEYLKKASWLVRCITQRNETLMRVASSLLKHQEEFFERGVLALSPLTMAEMGKELDLHESTISRSIANKFIHTPQGIYPLKYFFTTRLKTKAGDVSTKVIKEKIKAWVLKESPEKPITDKEMSDKLTRLGMPVVRRTVGKYREELNIPSALQRAELKRIH